MSERVLNPDTLVSVHDEAEAGRPLKTYEALSERLIQGIERGDAPWMRGWEPGEGELPYNHQTGNFYHGANLVSLMAEGRDDPRWLTRKQVEELGLRVRDEELPNGVVCHHYSTTAYKPRLDGNGNQVRDENGRVVRDPVALDPPKVYYFVVYNGEQVKGMPPFVQERPSEERLVEAYAKIHAMIGNMGVSVTHKRMEGKESAHYDADKDKIVMARKADYPDLRAYYGEMLQQVAHASGHKSRLNRGMEAFQDGHHAPSSVKKEQAFEALSVQLAAMMMIRTFNIGHVEHVTNGAYVKPWVKMLKKDPGQILKACHQAESIQMACLSYLHDHTLSKHQVQKQVLEAERSYKPAEKVKLSQREQATPIGVIHVAGPLPTAVEAAQVAAGKRALSQQERLISASLKAARLVERRSAIETWRRTAAIDPTINGLPPIVRSLASFDRRGETQAIYPMVDATGRLATVMVSKGPWQSAKLPEGVRNHDVFCPYAGLKVLVGDKQNPPPKDVKPAVIVGNAATGAALWAQGANVVMATSPTTMVSAANALRALRPDIPIIFALERGDRERDPKIPTVSNGRTYPNATVIRPPRGANVFVAKDADVGSYGALLQTAYGALKRGETAAKVDEARLLEKEQVKERELSRDLSQERSLGRGGRSR